MDLSNSIEIWRNVLKQPSEATFAAELEQEGAQLNTAIIWVIAASLINFIAQAITFLLFDPVQQFIDLYSEFMLANGTSQAAVDELFAQVSNDTFSNSLLLGLFLGVILFPLFFLIGSGFLWVVARAFGGSGTYGQQTYLLSTFYAPITIIKVLFSFIPFLGFFVNIALSIYQLILAYFALRVVHQFTPGKAMGSIVIPTLGIFAFFFCCLLFFMASLVAAGGGLS